MPYQVRLDAFVAITAGPLEAIKLFDDLTVDYPGQVSIHDMNGFEISVDMLRQAVQDNSKR